MAMLLFIDKFQMVEFTPHTKTGFLTARLDHGHHLAIAADTHFSSQVFHFGHESSRFRLLDFWGLFIFRVVIVPAQIDDTAAQALTFLAAILLAAPGIGHGTPTDTAHAMGRMINPLFSCHGTSFAQVPFLTGFK
jgi:hypothetical protein